MATIVKCPYVSKCWRCSYSKYLQEIGWKGKYPPERYVLFLAGYANGEQMKNEGKGGIFCERFPEKIDYGYRNICPYLLGHGYINCYEYRKEQKKRKRIREKKPFQRKREWLSFALRQQVSARDKYKCVYCGCSVHHTKCHVDHIVPLAKGGTNDVSNLCLSCQTCNLKKGDSIWTRDQLYINKGVALWHNVRQC